MTEGRGRRKGEAMNDASVNIKEVVLRDGLQNLKDTPRRGSSTR
jgi:hypothetical protein